MAAHGRLHIHIAEDLGGSVRTIQRWLRAYGAQGLEGLMIQWAPGRAPRLPEALAVEILAWISHGPTGCGLDRANWTYGELAAHLYRTHGLAVRTSTMGFQALPAENLRSERWPKCLLLWPPDRPPQAGVDLVDLHGVADVQTDDPGRIWEDHKGRR
jgi:hypothetical protein